MPDLTSVVLFIILFGLVALFLAALFYIVFTFFKWRGREDQSVDSVMLRVLVPRTNEVKN